MWIEWLEWLGFVLSMVASVIAALVAVGLLLPAKVPAVSHSLLIAAKRATVREALFAVSDVRSVAEATSVSGVRRRTRDEIEWLEVLGQNNTTLEWRQTAESETRVVRVARDRVVSLSLTVAFTLSDAPGGGTALHVVEEMEIRAGSWHVPFFRLIMRIAPAYGSKDFALRLKRFAEAKDAGVAKSK